MECVLCHTSFPSKFKLVQHFRETHSVAKNRPRRSRVVEGIRRIAVREFEGLEGEDEVEDAVVEKKIVLSLSCDECQNYFTSQASLEKHSCITTEGTQQAKPSISCMYCGQKCKNSRGATIHQVFCEQRLNRSGLNSVHYECPAEDCGAIFKGQHHLIKHVKNHHAEEGITVVRSPLPTVSTDEDESFEDSPLPDTSQQVTKSPMVTVTMKPHVGKTDGLQDLSLLITPAKSNDDSTESSQVSVDNNVFRKDSTSITVEECWPLDAGLKGEGQAVLCVAEDGSISQTPADSLDDAIDNEKTFLLITDNNILSNKCLRSYKCKFCGELFLEKVSLSQHIKANHESVDYPRMRVYIKEEPDDNYDCGKKRKDADEDWEFISFDKSKKGSDVSMCKGKYEYVCKLCNRNFLSELSYQNHIRIEECRNRKFKLPRMFSCHFTRCDSSFFKLTELQKHWQIAHKFSMASETHDFEDEKSFTSWLSSEEVKHKVRFTCDVRRRKPHRSERLMVCHRFHSLRTAAARKAANREYSDRHNWVHKIKPCLCYARMKVYQDFDKETCDYTGKIQVVYYPEHNHPESNETDEDSFILDHVLQRNKRNRDMAFQELKGSDKVQHRQKLEKLARSAGKEYRPPVRNPKMSASRKCKKEPENSSMLGSDCVTGVHVDNNFLENGEFFDSPVEMVLDGQFDMTHEVLTGPVVTHLDPLSMVNGNKVKSESYNCEGSDGSVVLTQEDVSELETEDASIVLPASSDDWEKLFQFARLRVESTDDSALKAEASLVLPYEKVIGLISPSDQIPIFQQLWELAQPAIDSDEVIQVVKINVVR